MWLIPVPRKGGRSPRVVVIGVGNPTAGDDAIGREVARSVAARAPAGVWVLEHSGEATSLMEAWKGADAVVLIDAVVSGAAAGTIHRIDAHAQRVPASLFCFSTHAFGVAEAVELARALGELPGAFLLYGIETERFAAGATVTPAVRSAADEVVRRVLGEIEQRFGV